MPRQTSGAAASTAAPPSRPAEPRRRVGGRLRWVRRGLLGLLALVVLAVVGTAGALWWTVPATRGELRVAGLSAPVAVTLDANGVPRITAETERDAAVAMGVLHARERLFQMETMRRGAQGRLSEIVGPAALRGDRLVRTLGLARRAEEDLAALPPDARDLLEGYAQGVNAWVAARGRFAAPEFVALGAPEPWRPEHSLLWGKIMGLWLSGDWRVELDRARLLADGVPIERIEQLWPRDESAGRPDLALPDAARRVDAGGAARLDAALPRFPEDPGALPASASNAWAVGAARSASGAPLLASDPHLGFQAPILWYLARVDLPGGRVRAGATSPGVPLVVIGRNERVAWGFTTTHSDTQDVFVERLAGPDAYDTPDGPRPFAVREEVIRVRGEAEPVRLRVRETRHGPVVSDLEAGGGGAGDTVLAVAMANLAPGDTAAAGLLALNRARSLAEVRAAAAQVTSPPQNLIAADADGRIGLFLTGRTPLRRAGDGAWPANGWDGERDWTGFAPFDALPHVQDPPSGAVVNANNRVAPPDSPVFLGRDWFGDWRFRRAGERLAAAPTHDAAGFAAMQRDTVSLLARDLLAAPSAVLRGTPRPAGAAGAALDLLLAWDGDVAADRPEPLIWAAWRESLLRAALAQGGVPPGGWRAGPEFLQVVLRPDGAGAAAWCGGDCPALAARALEEAVASLSPSLGPDPAAWRWGAVHVARFEHPVLRFVPVLGPLFRLEAATGGDGETISRGGYRGGTGPERFAHVHGAGLRLVADLADPDRTLAVIATGQSGNPFSRHWGDLLPAWRDGGTVRLTREPEAVTGRLRLVP